MACRRLATPNQLRRSQEVEALEAPGFSAAARPSRALRHHTNHCLHTCTLSLPAMYAKRMAAVTAHLASWLLVGDGKPLILR
jgi:hypothetical protein